MPPPVPVVRARGELEMTMDGMRLPERNAFDFTIKPSRDSFRRFIDGRRGAASKKEESGKQKIQKALLNIKRHRN